MSPTKLFNNSEPIFITVVFEPLPHAWVFDYMIEELSALFLSHYIASTHIITEVNLTLHATLHSIQYTR